MVRRVAFQGEHGSYSDAAVRQAFPEKVEGLGQESFEEVFKAVKSGIADLALLPIENTLGGSIHSNYDLLLRYPELFIVGETIYHVQHCLIALPGTEIKDVKKVLSHPQALAQCDDYCRVHGYKQEAYYDTAGSAKRLARREEKDIHCAAIASRLSAKIYGLQILDEDIQDDKNNYTRFIILSLTPAIPPPDTQAKTSLVFSLVDHAGALHKALSVFTLREINMTKIESRPGRKHLLTGGQFGDNRVKNSTVVALNNELKIIHETAKMDLKEKIIEKVEEYQTLFYLDISVSINEVRCHNALRHLAEICPFLRVLGCYPRNGVYLINNNDNTELIFPVSPFPMKSQRLKIGIIGFSRFGQFLTKHFLAAHHEVTAINLREGEDFTREAVLAGLSPKTSYYQGSPMLPRFFTKDMDVVIMAVSVISFEEVLTQVVPLLTDQLVVDVLSVKKHPKTLMARFVPETCDVVCTHPMFGPDSAASGWSGLPFIYEKIRVRDVHRTARFLAFFEDMGCRMVSMTAEEHDQLASGTQFVTHLTGRVLSGLGLQATQVDTTGYKMLLNLVRTTVRDSFDLFYGLYKHNEFSSEQLYSVEKALSKVKAELADYEKRGVGRGVTQPGDPGKIILNNRVEDLAPSKTGRVTDMAAEMRREGKDVITLSVGEPDFQPPERVVEAVSEAMRKGNTKYTPVVGTPALRKAISEYLRKEKNLNYSIDEIICSCGAKQSILQVILALCRPGDEVLIPAPYWVSYPEMVKLAGATPVVLPTSVKNNYCLPPEQLEAGISGNTRMLILCNPSNPTGQVYTSGQLRRLAEVLRRYPHVFVLSDEIYEKIIFEAEHVAFATLEGMWSRTITVNGFSKAYAMTGLRLGYLAAPKAIVEACAKIQSHNTSCPPSIVQHAGVVALETTEPTYFKNAIEGFREKRNVVLRELSKVGINVPVPQGAFYVFFDVSDFLSNEVPTSEELCLYLIKNNLVALVPGEAFGMPKHVRISYAISLVQLKEAMKRLTEGLQSLKKFKSAL